MHIEREIEVGIQRTSDGVIASGVIEGLFFSRFVWEEGNFSCDCNREIFFNDFLGVESDDDIECSEGRYLVRVVDADTGEMLYTEF